MAFLDQKLCTQFYAESFCEDMISFGKRVNNLIYVAKKCAYYIHNSDINGHVLNLYILPTDNKDTEGVECTIKFCDPTTSYLRIIGSKLVLKSTSIPVMVMEDFMDMITFWSSHMYVGRQYHKTYLNGKHHDNKRDNHEMDNNTAANFIETKLGYSETTKQKCFEEFKKLFSLSCLYVEHKVCGSMKQQGKHGSAGCTLCKRIEENKRQAGFKPVWNEGQNDKNIQDDVHLKSELLSDLKAIGYNMYGSRLVINQRPYAKPNPMHETREKPLEYVPFYQAIVGGHVSWIEAFLAVGIELGKDFPDGTLVKYTLSHAPETSKVRILKILLANGAVLQPCSYQTQNPYHYDSLYNQAPDVVERNDVNFLQQLVEFPDIKEKDLMPFITEAAGQCKTKCLEVLLNAAIEWNPTSLTRSLEFCAEGSSARISYRFLAIVENRPTCLKLLLSAGASVKHFKMNVRMWPIMKEEESVLFIYAAGFKDLEKQPVNLRNYTDHDLQVPEIFLHLDKKYRAKRKTSQDSGNIPVSTLLELCRECVRDELVKYNIKNLFHVVPILPLPPRVKAYLLHGASL